MWNADVQRITHEVVKKCEPLIAASAPAKKRTLLISEIYRSLNDVVRVDHFRLEKIFLFHLMDHYSKFSVAQPFLSTALSALVLRFDNLLFTQLWPSKNVFSDLAFLFDTFVTFLSLHH